MANKLMTKTLEKINYETIQMLCPTLLLASNILGLSSSLIDNPDISIFLLGSAFASIALGLPLSNENNLKYTKNIKEAYSLYNLFLNNYNELSRKLEISDPLDFYNLYCLALQQGYLSIPKSFNFDANCLITAPLLDGTVVFTGAAVCRNISSLLTDLANNYGYNACSLTVSHNLSSIIIKEVETSSVNPLDKIRQLCPNDKAYENYVNELEALNKKLEIMYFDYKKLGFPESLYNEHNNHVITYMHDSEKKYFLDPTHDTIYHQSSNNQKVLFTDHAKAKIERRYRNLGNPKVMKSIKSYLASVSELEYLESKAKMEYLFCNNLDIFESFNSDNQELMEEILFQSPKVQQRKK